MKTNLLKKGMIVKCIDDFFMEDGRLAYENEHYYKCDKDGCLTDEQGCVEHGFSKENERLLFQYFKPVTNN